MTRSRSRRVIAGALRGGLLALGAGTIITAGCKARRESPAFERRFARARARSGLDDVQIIDSRHRPALKGNVQRLGKPTLGASTGRHRAIPLRLTQNQVGRVIRRQLARLYDCQKLTAGRSGKVLLTLQISFLGSVSRATASAPAFRGTRLAQCLENAARGWWFPRFKSGSIQYTYPLIFR